MNIVINDIYLCIYGIRVGEKYFPTIHRLLLLMQDALFSVFACEGKDLQVIGSGYLLYHSPHGELQGEGDRRSNSTGQKSLRSKSHMSDTPSLITSESIPHTAMPAALSAAETSFDTIGFIIFLLPD